MSKSQLEHLCTQELLLRFPPPAPLSCSTCPTPHRFTSNRRRSALQPGAPLETVTLGDARTLPFADDSADAVLLFGPLYHLVKRWDRLAVPREARRTLRPGGVLFAASRDRFASAFDALFEGYPHNPDLRAAVDRALSDEQHRSPDGTSGTKAEKLSSWPSITAR